MHGEAVMVQGAEAFLDPPRLSLEHDARKRRQTLVLTKLPGTDLGGNTDINIVSKRRRGREGCVHGGKSRGGEGGAGVISDNAIEDTHEGLKSAVL